MLLHGLTIHYTTCFFMHKKWQCGVCIYFVHGEEFTNPFLHMGKYRHPFYNVFEHRKVYHLFLRTKLAALCVRAG